MGTPAQELFDASVRVDEIIYIPGAVADMEATPERFREFCEDLPTGAGHPLYEQLPELAPFADKDREPDPADVAEALLRKPGFIVKAATPVRDYRGNPNASSWMQSWGYYHTGWLYAATEADIAPACLKWAAECGERDKAKAAA